MDRGADLLIQFMAYRDETDSGEAEPEFKATTMDREAKAEAVNALKNV